METQGTYFRRSGCEDHGEGAQAGHNAYRREEPAGRSVFCDPPGKYTIRDLVGEAAWWRLSAAVRERFATSPAARECWHFRGIMARVECSWSGRAMAWVSRATGAPVAHLTGRNVPIDVFVYAEQGGDGTVWERAYVFAGDRSVTARTTKRIDGERQMLECFGLGFGMELDVYECDQALHFRSTSFFIALAGRRLRLPPVLSPGTLLVEHIDEGGGSFRFRMTVDHAALGRVFFQDGLFRNVEE